ncbi:MAG: hypothetical protein MPW16_20335 [Candidatus Manganitrophus sp.]|nr:MAG: hypothetical protein MPW16_20335 [Candidatus Manganitrophus sp.]
MSSDENPIDILVDYTRGLLARLEEFFLKATGSDAIRFAPVADFDNTIRSMARQIGPRGESAFVWLDTEVRKFQAREGMAAFKAAKELGGTRLVLGGSRFQGSQLRSVRNSLLYGDTILIPDPVLPWLERSRDEERFQHVLVLKTVHCLLHLKPLVDADLPYPAVAVFPSWEKSLEDNDKVTISGIQQLVADIVTYATGVQLSTLDEVVEYADTFMDEFVHAANRNILVVAPNGAIGEPIKDALRKTDEDHRKWRSDGWNKQYDQLPPQRKIINVLLERVAPIYHLIENAQEFRGHPLMCLEQQAHYFGLISKLGGKRLEQLHYLKPETMALVNALGSKRLEWLGSVDMDALIRLRQDNQNEEFRGILSSAMSRLGESELDDVDLVAAEICHNLEVAIAKHGREMQAIQRKYKSAHGQTLALAAGAFGAMIMPALMPLLGTAAPLALAAKYGYDKVAELREKRDLTHSLIGVLASAKSDG